MAERRFYQEELFFPKNGDELEQENQNKIVDLLNRNVAVGVVGGFYEEGFPVYFISSFALRNMGMSYEQFMERTGGQFLQNVYEADRKIFTRVCPFGEENVRQYRVYDQAGNPIWVRETRTASTSADGRKIWIGAIRLIDEEHRNKQLADEAIGMLQDAYFRISAIDLNKNNITDLKIVESEALEVERLNGDYRMTIASCAKNHVEENDRESFRNIMSAENLKVVFLNGGAPIHFSYRRLVEGEWKWVRSELVPVENFGEDNARVMWYVKNITAEKAKEREMMDQMLRKNAELIQAKEELEQANIRIQESNEILRRTLNAEEQYRQAIVSEAVYVYNVNVTKNLIEEEFYDLTNGQERPVLAWLGLTVPCNADDFFLRWCKEKVFPEDRELYAQETNTRQMLEAYERGESELVIEFEAEGPNGQPVVLRRTILLTKDESNGDILALINAKDITEARRKDKEARKALLDAYEAADRASCAKTDFLSKMSHDIRTPMNAIIGMTAIAGTKLHDPEGVAECLNKVSGASRYLLSLINEVLDMSRIESGTMSLQEEDFDLIDMISNLEKVLSASAREKRQNITVRTHDIQNSNVMGDILRIQQAFMNVAQNAIMYTPEEGEISIEVTEKPSTQYQIGCYEFVFKDNGIGMSPEFLKRIFKPFERAEDVRISKVQGTGLGLTISRNIIHMMDGDIEIESELGVGTIVTITLPLKHQEPGQAEDIDLTGRMVLVVDDEPFTCETTCMLLEKLGMQGEWVLSGQEALEYVLKKQEKKEELFAILLDCKMPGGLSGMETAKAIRREIRSNVPIVMFSAYDWADIETEAQVAGIDAFVMKPLDEGRLVNVFKRFMRREKVPSLEHTLDQIEEADYSHKRILVVEDNDLNREIAMEILSMSGAQVETAENGQKAVEMMEASSAGYYDLILMDLQMPIMNGYEATTAIRDMNREDARNVPIVAMTANAFLEDVQKSKACGMNEHMSKPLDIEQLQQMLTRWLGKKKKAN